MENNEKYICLWKKHRKPRKLLFPSDPKNYEIINFLLSTYLKFMYKNMSIFVDKTAQNSEIQPSKWSMIADLIQPWLDSIEEKV